MREKVLNWDSPAPAHHLSLTLCVRETVDSVPCVSMCERASDFCQFLGEMRFTLHSDAQCCRVLQSVAECCRVLQSVAVCCGEVVVEILNPSILPSNQSKQYCLSRHNKHTEP